MNVSRRAFLPLLLLVAVLQTAALGYIVGRTIVRVNSRPIEGDSRRGATLSVAPIVTRRARGVQLSVLF